MTREQALEMIMNPRGGPSEGTAEHRELMAYVEDSVECRTLYEQQRAVWESLDLWGDVEPSAGFDRRLFEKIEGQTAGGSWFPGLFGSWRPTFAIGLAGLVIAAATVIYRQPQGSPKTHVIAEDAEYVEQIHTALDDLEMLAEFDVLPLGG